MADLQQSVVSDVETKQQINNQIVQWEENLERLHCEQFRLRCYMASLQSGELPNPKVSNYIQEIVRKSILFVCFIRFMVARGKKLLQKNISIYSGSINAMRVAISTERK